MIIDIYLSLKYIDFLKLRQLVRFLVGSNLGILLAN